MHTGLPHTRPILLPASGIVHVNDVRFPQPGVLQTSRVSGTPQM